MQIRKPRTFDIEDVDRKKFYEDIFKAFNKNISFGRTANSAEQNIEGYMADVTGALNTGPANTDFIVTHNLGYLPRFFQVHYKEVNCDIYKGLTPWSTTQASLRCTAVNAQVRIFIH